MEIVVAKPKQVFRVEVWAVEGWPLAGLEASSELFGFAVFLALSLLLPREPISLSLLAVGGLLGLATVGFV